MRTNLKCQWNFNCMFHRLYWLGWRKEWIWSERQITICPVVTCWTHARSTRWGITARTHGNKDQSGLSHRLHYRETLSPPPAGGAQGINFGRLAAISWHWLRLVCLDWPAGFESTCVWPSKVLVSLYTVLCCQTFFIPIWHWDEDQFEMTIFSTACLINYTVYYIQNHLFMFRCQL